MIGVDRHPVDMTLDAFHQADLSDPQAIDALVAALPARLDGLAISPEYPAPPIRRWWQGSTIWVCAI
ncbi:hypothetical protein [Salinicola tamaricis]|uniref:hypothetical protein n=1 Tax=Salinicola tamaricis TaxID=1771309 RepID=UPI001F5D3158|nr:hypothetical protein [Salinicola tamaricis]